MNSNNEYIEKEVSTQNNSKTQEVTTEAASWLAAHLLEAGHGVCEHQVQHGVVLHQRVVLVVPDELHHRAKGQGVREAVFPIAVVDFDEFVVAVFPGKRRFNKIAEIRSMQTKSEYRLHHRCVGGGGWLFYFTSGLTSRLA